MSVTLETPTRFEQVFDPVEPATPSQGRRWVSQSLGACGCVLNEEVAYALDVIVSELLTNVCLHAPGAALLTLRIWNDTLQLVVADQCANRVGRSVHPAPNDDEHHRGVDLIEKLCGSPLIERAATCAATGFVKELVVTFPLCSGAR